MLTLQPQLVTQLHTVMASTAIHSILYTVEALATDESHTILADPGILFKRSH